MRRPRLVTILLLAGVASAGLPGAASGQGWLNRIKQKAKEKIQQRVDQTTDSVTDVVYDKSEHVVKCVMGDRACIRKAQAAGRSVAVVDARGEAVSSADSAQAIAAAGGATGSMAAPAPNGAPSGVDPHNDFTPGTDVLYQTSFASATLGDFPRDIQLVDGNAEAVNWNGARYLRATSRTTFRVKLPAVLPQRFTLEFDYAGSSGHDMSVTLAPDADGEQPHGEIDFSTSGNVAIRPYKGASSGTNIGEMSNQIIHCAIMADSDYVKAYVNGKRAGNSPNAPLGRTNVIEFYIPGGDDDPAYITNIRVAAGGRDMYQALSTEGRFTTHGIQFASGSAAIDPTSATVLAQIGQMLQQHPDLRLEIDGHTDNVGTPAANMALSDRRAAAVKQYLVSHFQVDPARLASKGFGATKPVASNATEIGRAQNRRVELVKI